MEYKLIELADGTLVEVEDKRPQAEQIADQGVAFLEDVSFENRVKPILLKITKPLASVWDELNQEMSVDKAEVELGLGFQGEGNLFVTKAVGRANFMVKLTMSPKAVANVKDTDKD